MEIKFTEVFFQQRKKLLTIIMRTFIFLFCTITFAFTSKNGFSQNMKIKIDADKTISIEKVFELIKKQTNYAFVYEHNLFKDSPKIELKKGEIRVGDLLKKSLSHGEYGYSFDSVGTILLEKKSLQGKITGKVVDNKNEPIIGATVLLKGTTKGVITDFDGAYSIKASKGDVLVFQSIGHVSKEIVVGDATIINVTLKESTATLDEVVITTGYDKVSKRTFTGAASTIKVKDLKMDGVVDVSRMLEGRSAGVNIQNISGTFGSAPKITIRGSSSIFGNNTPLYVIDGVVQEDIVSADFSQLTSGNAETLISSSIAGINANDIKKIDILKDASATSLYGARARNGVVVITTKSGRKSTPLKISYTLEETVRDVPSYANYDILNSKENISILKELKNKGYLELPNVAQARYGGIYSIMAKRINTYNPDTHSFLLENTPEAKNKFLQQYELGNTNWFKTLFRKSLTQSHSLSFTGGGDNNAFYSSLSFFTDPGWSIAENVSRLTANLKNTFLISDKFNLTVSANTSIRKQKAPGTFDSKTDTYHGAVSRDFDINPFSYVLNTSRTLRPRDTNGNLEYYTNNWAPFNILDETRNNYIDLNLRDLRLQIDGEYKINDKLTYNFNASSRYVNSTIEHKIKRGSNVVKAYNSAETTIIRDDNIFLYQDPDDLTAPPVAVFPKGGIYIKSDNYLTSYYVRNSFKYNSIINDKHELDFLVGQEVRYVDQTRNSFTGYGLQYDNGYTAFTDPRLLEKIITDGTDYFSITQKKERTAAFFGRATYGYDNKYVFSVTGRYDGSNKQGRSASSRWLPTGTVSAKWNIKNEKFLENVNTINNLQLRTSYGLVATPGSATNALAIYKSETTGRLRVSDRESALNISALQNSELTWEKQYELNVGLDVGLFDNRIAITTDVYSRKIFDNVDYITTSGIGGESVKKGNNADVSTKGFEFSLSSTNIQTDNFSWSTMFNISYYHQKITKLQNKPDVFQLVRGIGGNIKGYPINSLFSYKFDGLSNRGIPTFDLTQATDKEHVDFQDNNKILKYLKYEGSVDPNVSGGFTNTFKYKNWNLNILITGSAGNKIRLNPLFKSRYSDSDVFSKDFKNRWVLPGDEKATNIPIIPNNQLGKDPYLSRKYNAYNNSTARVADGSFARMKSISLGYSLNKELTDKLGLSYFRIKVQGTNLFLLYSDDKLNGQDPEFYQTGGVALPIRRQYTLSINVGI